MIHENKLGMNSNLCVGLCNMIVSGGHCRILLGSKDYIVMRYHV